MFIFNIIWWVLKQYFKFWWFFLRKLFDIMGRCFSSCSKPDVETDNKQSRRNRNNSNSNGFRDETFSVTEVRQPISNNSTRRKKNKTDHQQTASRKDPSTSKDSPVGTKTSTQVQIQIEGQARDGKFPFQQDENTSLFNQNLQNCESGNSKDSHPVPHDVTDQKEDKLTVTPAKVSGSSKNYKTRGYEESDGQKSITHQRQVMHVPNKSSISSQNKIDERSKGNVATSSGFIIQYKEKLQGGVIESKKSPVLKTNDDFTSGNAENQNLQNPFKSPAESTSDFITFEEPFVDKADCKNAAEEPEEPPRNRIPTPNFLTHPIKTLQRDLQELHPEKVDKSDKSMFNNPKDVQRNSRLEFAQSQYGGSTEKVTINTESSVVSKKMAVQEPQILDLEKTEKNSSDLVYYNIPKNIQTQSSQKRDYLECMLSSGDNLEDNKEPEIGKSKIRRLNKDDDSEVQDSKSSIGEKTDQINNKKLNFTDANSSSQEETINVVKQEVTPDSHSNQAENHQISSKKSSSSEQNGQLQIIDLQEYFNNDLNFDSIKVSPNSLEYLEIIRKEAEKLEAAVRSFSGTDYSIEYFLLDEKLMRLIERLDKIHCQGSPERLSFKLDTIGFIDSLHTILDGNVVE